MLHNHLHQFFHRNPSCFKLFAVTKFHLHIQYYPIVFLLIGTIQHTGIGSRCHIGKYDFPIIIRRSNAVISGNNKWTQRDRHVHRIRTDGVYQWRRESGYYRQSIVENYRYKTTIGKRLRARTEESREVEAKIACQMLNRFIELDRAKSERVA